MIGQAHVPFLQKVPEHVTAPPLRQPPPLATLQAPHDFTLLQSEGVDEQLTSPQVSHAPPDLPQVSMAVPSTQVPPLQHPPWQTSAASQFELQR